MYPTRSRPKNNENAGLLICEMQIEKKERKKKAKYRAMETGSRWSRNSMVV
jgi:ribosome assembly protein YihI (activator of Der GTPase)